MSDHQINAILIGGVGGSGTRIFAEALLTAGMRTLTDLNRACDAQGCSLLFKRPDVLKDIKAGAPFSQLASILDAAINGEHPLDRADRLRLRALTREPRLHHSPWWLWKRSRALRRDAARQRQSGAWFIKEPNLHIVAGELLALRPETKFVMAVRHGVDMAFSSNQQQVAVWGHVQVVFVGEEGLDAGGVQKEFFMLLLKDILHPQFGMFREDEESKFIWFSDEVSSTSACSVT